MKRTTTILTYIITILFFSFAKTETYKNENIKVLITIDNNPLVQLKDLKFIVNETGEIIVKYDLGRINLTENDLVKLKRSEKVRFVFSYYIGKCNIKERNYDIGIKTNLLFQGYLYLRIYNFEFYPRLFIKNTGYGFEFDSPLRSESLPTRRRENVIFVEPKGCK